MTRRTRKKRLGLAFSESLAQVKPQFKNHSSPERSRSSSWGESLLYGFTGRFSTGLTSSWRRVLLLIIFLIAFFGLFLRLFHLQVVLGKEYRDLADSNRVKVRVIHAPRGVIYDRNGKILAENEPGFRQVQKTADGKTQTSYITRDQAIQMEVTNAPEYKDLEIDSLRSYPYGATSSQVLGYMGQLNQNELSSPDFSTYKVGDNVGRGGIEESYEKVLRGVDGGEIIEVDAGGKTIRTLSKTDPIPGQDIYLSLDIDLQLQTQKLLAESIAKNKSCCGAAIVSDPSNGQVLALVSLPSFDPKNISQSLSASNFPFLDRAIAGTYPPGSTFKIVSSLAGLSSGKITPQTIFEDNGVTTIGPYRFTNWYFTQYGRTEGPVDMVKAIQRSNDTYFYNLGQVVGENNLAAAARNLGFGKSVGIDLPGEVAGLVPDDNWKEQNIGQVWYPGDTLHMAIGQGYTLVTPLQILNMTSIVATNGQEFPIHLVNKITGPDGSVIKQFNYHPTQLKVYNSEQINTVKQGLSLVPKYGGTAWPFFTFPLPTAGKTGTAEYGNEDKTHAWYTSYAPPDNPKIAATVLVEGGGEGSNVSAPVVKEIYRYFFSPDKTKLIPDLGQVATDSGKSLGE